MKLLGLLTNVEYKIIQGTVDLNIKKIVDNSGNVTNDSLFVCITGYKTDGHKYIRKAIEKGAIAIIVQSGEQVICNNNITIIEVKNARKVLAIIANKFYNKPTQQFGLIGVTGTNGKTSTVFLINNILEEHGRKTGLVGTIKNKIGNKCKEASRTTPDILELQQIFTEMVEENVNDVIMEVSSHALELYRVYGCEFDIGVFTNLTLDHLDFHNTMEDYRDAKLKLFKMCKHGVINIDDKYGKYMIENGNCIDYLTYSCYNDKASLKAKEIQNNISGATFKLIYSNKEYIVKLQTPGIFSVYNALAAIGASIYLGLSIESVINSLETRSRITGRFQPSISKKGYIVIVDYAHTPDGLENVLNTIKEFACNKVITVFGCGGDRDRSKRPAMGKLAGDKSDYCIITSDNPRTERPDIILDEIEEGIVETNCKYDKIIDRKEAILKALSLANKGDIILIAGKGHEDYQIIGYNKTHFDDSEIVLKYFQEE
jgi:UDP-N-acetylmuramoyl-L-alanyl-D-glutamate--2,6-diaminopimelate ligase